MIDRARAVETLAAEEFDLVVIGGGITGAGVALDAAARGLTVALVERHDYAAGASGRSGKLLDGDAEGTLIAQLAPRLVRPLPLAAPAALGGERPTEVAAAFTVDDARLVLAVLAEAGRRGAVAANRLEAVAVVERAGGIAGVEVRDAELGGRFVVVADRVINATGAWAGGPAATDIKRSTHVVLGDEDVPLDGAGVPLTSAGIAPAVARPWLGRVLVGPAGDDHRGDVDATRPPDEDVDRLLDAVNSSFGTGVGRAEVSAAFTAIWGRPALRVGENGLITVVGGGLGSWRRDAQRAVDCLLEHDARSAPSRTAEILLAPRRNTTMPDRGSAHLIDRYGAAATEVLALASAEHEPRRTIVDGQPDLLAEAAYAARDEQARSVGDVLLRRTRLGLVAAREACDPDVALRVAAAMAPVLGWSERRARDEAAAWMRETRAEGLEVYADLVKDPFKAAS